MSQLLELCLKYQQQEEELRAEVSREGPWVQRVRKTDGVIRMHTYVWTPGGETLIMEHTKLHALILYWQNRGKSEAHWKGATRNCGPLGYVSKVFLVIFIFPPVTFTWKFLFWFLNQISKIPSEPFVMLSIATEAWMHKVRCKGLQMLCHWEGPPCYPWWNLDSY